MEKKKEIKGKKPQAKVERYLTEPRLELLFGVEVNEDTDIDDVACNGEIHQTIKDLVLTTEINRKRETPNGKAVEEHDTLRIELEPGTRLIWTETEGYILTGFKPMTRKEIIESLDDFDGIEGLE